MESTIKINADGTVTGLTEAQIDSVIIALKVQANGYHVLKNNPMIKRMKMFRDYQPELRKMPNNELEELIEFQMQQSKDCVDFMVELEKWKNDHAVKAELNIVKA